MKTTPIAILLISLSLLVTSFRADSKVLLRLNLEKGTTYEMTLNMTNSIDQEMMGQKMKLDQKTEMGFSFQVLDILPNKNFQIGYSLTKMKLNMNINGQDVSFDTESTDESNPVYKSLKNLVNIRIKMELTPRGIVENIEGLEQFEQQLAGNQQMALSMQMFMNEKNFGSFVGQTFSYFPEEKIEKGTRWTSTFSLPALMNMEIKMNYDVESVSKENIILNVNSDVDMDTPIEQNGMKIEMKMTGTQNGTMTINPVDGWLRESDLNQKFDIHMKMKNPQSGEDMEIPMLMNSIVKFSVVRKYTNKTDI